jgi:cytidylate kinase
MVITIDGPAGSGKSTAARGLARRLEFQFLDTGAMYRVVGLRCVERGIDVRDEAAVANAAESVSIAFAGGRVFADGVDVTEAIRGNEVTRVSSIVAANAEVRRTLNRLQRQFAQGANIVTEGRDQGTVVFPDAECKFYLVANPDERARRRQKEFEEKGTAVSYETLRAEITARDERDANRPVAPLKPAADAVRIDTTYLSEAEVLAVLESIVRSRGAGQNR